VSNQVLRELTKALLHLSEITGRPDAGWVPEAIQACQELYKLADDSSQVMYELADLIRSLRLSARQVHDANIVATMKVHGIQQLLTHNTKDFAVFGSEIEVVSI
jgi:predicted nucleic acid-binding protein